MLERRSFLNFILLFVAGSAFQIPTIASVDTGRPKSRFVPMKATAPSSNALFDPLERQSQYNSNHAQYLVDLHDSKATFDFCGGSKY
jgi:hypothetical protein